MGYGTRTVSVGGGPAIGIGDLLAGAAVLAFRGPLVLALLVVVACGRSGARGRARAGLGDLGVLVQRTSVAVVSVALTGADTGAVVPAAVVACVVAATGRLVEKRRADRRVATGGGDRTVLVGTGDDLTRAARLLASHPEHGIQPVATATPDGSVPTVLPGGHVDDLASIVERNGVGHVLLVSAACEDAVAAVFGRERPYGVRVSVLPPLAELLTAGADVIDVRGLPLLSLGGRRRPHGAAWAVKRGIDFTVAAAGLLALAPLFAVVAALIRLDSRGPAFFRQERVGRGGRTFRLWKFRTMVVDAEQRLASLRAENEANGPFFKLENDPRVTRVGRWLRRISVDELPQLINVLRGEMSLVGPRPFLPNELEAAPEVLRWRLGFLPGITGPWQVAGRSWLPVEEGVRMDLAYVEHWSPRLDLLVMARTATVALKGDRRPSCLAGSDPVRLTRARYVGKVVGDDLRRSPMPATVTAVVVTHESRQEIEACLRSLRAAAEEVDLEVIVVDNASTDGTPELVAEAFPEVRLIRKARRGGFAENCNIGAVAAAGRHLLMLNPDARLRPGAARALVRHLERHPDVGVVGPRLVYPDGRPQAGARRFPTVRATLVRRTPLRLVLRNSAAERDHLAQSDTVVECDVDWMLGAAVLIRGEAFRELDGFDDGYRLYCEDIDLCWRLHQLGWRVRYAPGIVVEHALGELTRRRFFTVRTWWHVRSMVRFVRLQGLPVTRTTPVPEPAVAGRLLLGSPLAVDAA
jgi:exopolysaccharide biosynthesis polyprenyl glycosylphosphotransferase